MKRPMLIVRAMRAWVLPVMAGLVVGCGGGDPSAPKGASAAKKDAPAAAGTPAAAFKQGQWQAGDAVAWQQQLRTRAQYGMNDYTRVNP